ncbi:MAG: hypothetical protein QM599_00010 [Pseudoxanthomonas sp.]
MRKLTLHEEAKAEANEAVDWLYAHNAKAAPEFEDALADTLAQLRAPCIRSSPVPDYRANTPSAAC